MMNTPEEPTGLRAVVEDDVRSLLGGLELEVEFRASGHKSSEGDGRTAADIRRELEETTDGPE